MLVEDEFLAAVTTIDALESMGCEVVGPAARIEPALQLARSAALDAAVLDVNINGQLVWPVAEVLQRRGVPFLFHSAYSDPSMIPAEFASALYLPKPLDERRLLDHLSIMWAGH